MEKLNTEPGKSTPKEVTAQQAYDPHCGFKGYEQVRWRESPDRKPLKHDGMSKSKRSAKGL